MLKAKDSFLNREGMPIPTAMKKAGGFAGPDPFLSKAYAPTSTVPTSTTIPTGTPTFPSGGPRTSPPVNMQHGKGKKKKKAFGPTPWGPMTPTAPRPSPPPMQTRKGTQTVQVHIHPSTLQGPPKASASEQGK